jgi:hypothetical protein
MIASQSNKSARRTRRFSPGHGRARLDIRQSSPIVRQFTKPAATRRSFVTASPSNNSLHRLDPNRPDLPRRSNLHSAYGTI